MIWFRKYFLFSRLFSILRKLNHRNHRKLTLIDDKKAFIGSLNFIQVHSSQFQGSKAWRDSGVFLMGSGVNTLSNSFKYNWGKATKTGFKKFLFKPRLKFWKKKFSNNPFVRLNTNWRERWKNYRVFRKKILLAQKKVGLVTAYFLPKRSLLRALIKAAQAGIQVEIILELVN